MSLDGQVEHADSERHLFSPAFGAVLEEHIEHRRVEVAIGIIVTQVEIKCLLQGLHKLPGFRAVAAEVEVERGFKADGFVLGQADFFVQQLQELLHHGVFGEVGGQVHGGSTQEWVRGMVVVMTVFVAGEKQCQAYQEEGEGEELNAENDSHVR